MASSVGHEHEGMGVALDISCMNIDKYVSEKA